MIIEFLTFDIEPGKRAEWLEVERNTWSAALGKRPGFVRKEVWVSEHDPCAVHAVIWWADKESWQSMGVAEVTAVDASMGEWFHESTMVSYRLLRDG